MNGEVDIAILGAGAAGLSAALALTAAPASFAVLEARDRVGGRAVTVDIGGMPLDLGAHWLHSGDRNPFAGIARRLGFSIDETPAKWNEQTFGVEMSPAEVASFGQALVKLEDRVSRAAAAGRDRPIAELFEPDCRWNPLLDAFSSFYNGAEFDRISSVDYDRYQDDDVNWRVAEGYGALLSTWAAEVPVAMGVEVLRIDHAGPRVRIETSKGELSCRAAIVTLPTSVLAALPFAPDLPETRAAAEALPLGLADKVFLEIADPRAFPSEGHLFGNPHSAETGSYHLRPFGRPIIEAFLGGRHAETLEREGQGAAAAFALEELVSLLGSDMRKTLQPIVASAWLRDPHARGSYSHAVPGGAWARAVLARPHDDRIFFAGEATSLESFSTVHGAAASGARAAREALLALGLAPPPEAS
jgi:monoamine oxidase